MLKKKRAVQRQDANPDRSSLSPDRNVCEFAERTWCFSGVSRTFPRRQRREEVCGAKNTKLCQNGEWLWLGGSWRGVRVQPRWRGGSVLPGGGRLASLWDYNSASRFCSCAFSPPRWLVPALLSTRPSALWGRRLPSFSDREPLAGSGAVAPGGHPGLRAPQHQGMLQTGTCWGIGGPPAMPALTVASGQLSSPGSRAGRGVSPGAGLW